MAGIGPGAGLAGFLEGFSKSLTQRKDIEAQHKMRTESFVTDALIKSALQDPHSVVSNPQLTSELSKRLGPAGNMFTEFLQHHAGKLDEDAYQQRMETIRAEQAASTTPGASVTLPLPGVKGGKYTIKGPKEPGAVKPPATPEARYGAEAINRGLQPGTTEYNDFVSTAISNEGAKKATATTTAREDVKTRTRPTREQKLAEKHDAEMNKPLSAVELQKYVGPNGEVPQPGATRQQMLEGGFRIREGFFDSTFVQGLRNLYRDAPLAGPGAAVPTPAAAKPKASAQNEASEFLKQYGVQ